MMTHEPISPLTCGDVAKLFNVRPVTVAKWADEGKLPYFWTPGGHRRFRVEDVRAILDGDARPDEAATA